MRYPLLTTQWRCFAQTPACPEGLGSRFRTRSETNAARLTTRRASHSRRGECQRFITLAARSCNVNNPFHRKTIISDPRRFFEDSRSEKPLPFIAPMARMRSRNRLRRRDLLRMPFDPARSCWRTHLYESLTEPGRQGVAVVGCPRGIDCAQAGTTGVAPVRANARARSGGGSSANPGAAVSGSRRRAAARRGSSQRPARTAVSSVGRRSDKTLTFPRWGVPPVARRPASVVSPPSARGSRPAWTRQRLTLSLNWNIVDR